MNARRIVSLVVTALIATILIVVAAFRVDWPSVGGELAQAKLMWVAVALVFYFGIVFLWAAQWWALLPRDIHRPYATIFEIVAVMALVANTVPYMIGHGAGAVLLSTRGKVGNAIAVSVLALEQLAEGIAKLGVLLLVALLIPLPSWLAGGMVGLTGSLLILMAVFLLAIAWHRFPFNNKTRVESASESRLRRFLKRLAGHLESVRDWRVFGLGLAFTLGMKSSEAIGIAAVQHAFGMDPTVGGVLLVLAATNIATMISLVPGNLGVYEGAAYLAYSYLGVPAEQAIGMGVIHHFCTLVAMVGAGYFIVVTRGVGVPRTRSLVPHEPEN